ncbi:hypothetical protein DFP72DRAFT_1129577 [Ephemerocybe angulata]|uniref:Uncharacterized protein n=1 Tax=Ephemerocybe angulata TaxID=980116 RepID=A0A8H6IEU7_9AGAR|nr:hypothetical protein DFP72DRAFT_1129577 [Tulosesus angulatus]
MRPPPLIFSEQPCYSTRFCDDPWPEDDESHCSGKFSASSSRTSSTSSSHVLPESAFMGADGRFLNFHSKEETSSSKRLGQPKLSVFIAQMIYLAGASRFRAKLPATSDGSFGFSGHMLWLGAFVIACSQDSMLHFVPEAHSAAYWSEMTLYSEREVDEVYRELWSELDGNVTVFPSYASALEKLKNPIQVPPSSFRWEEELWNCDGDGEDDGDGYSNSEHDYRSVEGEHHGPPATSKMRSPPQSTPSKPKFKGLTSSPASSRTRAVSSRLVSFFKKKA